MGSVVDVERDANDVVQTAFLAPAANLDSFDLALVITDYDGRAAARGRPARSRAARRARCPRARCQCYTPAPSVKASPKVTPKP